jgi:hypothetical protein
VQRPNKHSRVVIPLIVLIVAIGGSWWFWQRNDAGSIAQVNGASGGSLPIDTGERSAPAVPEAVIAAEMPTDTASDEVLTPVGPGAGIALGLDSATGDEAAAGSPGEEPGLAQVFDTEFDQAVAGENDTSEGSSRNPRIDASLQRYRAGQVIAARQELNRMLAISRDPVEQAELRRHLEKVADATIFSRERRADDPLTDTYTIQPGDVLINIGRQFHVPHEVIMMINGIEDATRIRAGQQIKVPRGPFHAKIYKSKFRLDVYLQDLFVRCFPVALGTDAATPEGKWNVKERLLNPAYYPPASAEIKRVIPPDDPTNPLGEHWIGLEGIEGDAVGREGYGIHGTIEPESIGKAVSLGCIRMHNKDVAFLYKLMLPGRSTVTTLP